MIVYGQNSRWGTNVSGHKRVWAQSCMGTNVVETELKVQNVKKKFFLFKVVYFYL